MGALTPAEVLFDGAAPPVLLPPCDHYAGSEKLIEKSLALQAQLGPIFDVTLDCEDGAAVGRESEHAALVASFLYGEKNRFGRVGVRIHDYTHRAWRDDVRIVIGAAAQAGAAARAGSAVPGRTGAARGDPAPAPAYITLPKVDSVAATVEQCAFIEACRRDAGLADSIPIHLLIETHAALAAVFELAALPAVQSLSFGLMDFVSAHHGAIPDAAMRSPGQFDHPLVRRAKLEIAAACHAHGKVPSHNVTTEIRDTGTVASDAARARAEFGYTRMWSIHPAQIEPIVAAFVPRDDEINVATEILLAAQAASWGPIRHARGDEHSLHDRASYRYYWSVLRRAHAAGRPVPVAAAAWLGLSGDRRPTQNREETTP
jgi:citrate lyase subunit beta/citryl-CoA lyase